METITSRTNPLCTHLRKLAASASYRRSCGEFLCDSPKLLEEALLWGADLHTVVCTDPSALPVLPEAVRGVQVPPDLMESISPAQTPQGVLAVCGLPDQALPETLEGRRYAVLDGVQDPGNVGTILRTADALYSDGLLLVGGCADLYQPKTVRASMGAVLRCPVWSCTADEAEGLAVEQRHPPLRGGAAGGHRGRPGRGLRPRAIAIGSEGRGLSAEMLALCDATVQIPMAEHCESLNAAAAAAVLLWELARRDAPGK